ncbi:esterase-like activity of phytase family protein [Amorphus sp. 3PC139-8]|uniref:esterase-like activity of phytase family protein n=1 Tax=Amorphus sp. 3PC139-8 TaxID=2735676 RepID=UPI00345D4C64
MVLATLGAAPLRAEPINIDAAAISQFHVRDPARRFGDLVFLGGLNLTARDRDFGGFSGVLASPDGTELLLVSDLGRWLTLSLDQGADGTPRGIAHAELTPRLTEAGETPPTKAEEDAEALARKGDQVLVSVESGRKLLAYPGPDPVGDIPTRLPLPAETRCLPGNGGLEAMAVAPPSSPVAGSLMLFAERACRKGAGLTGEGMLPFWRVTPNGSVVRGALVRDRDYRPTDAAFLPGGDLLLLERRYDGGIDIGMQVRRIGRDALAARAPLTGPVLMEADFAYEIDNMEGIAVSADGFGRPLMTLISDDNRSLLQRTLLLRFRLETPVPRPKPQM